jgi:UDP-N-acetylglucosamine diphosphorylase/glucosamine-1-phosphate N-acetyltransferase
MNFILFDDERAENFLPFTHTRPISEMRCGIWTLKEKWESITSVPPSYHCAKHLQALFPIEINQQNIFINSACFPNDDVFANILELKLDQCLLYGDILIAANLNESKAKSFTISDAVLNCENVHYSGPIKMLENVWDIFSQNKENIESDFERITRNRTSQPINNTNTLIGNNIFIEEGARVQGAILNSTEGPIYVGRNAEIMEGSVVRGPLALCDKSVLKLSTKIYGATTIGPGSKVGGEVNNSVFFSNSNKGHDGFLGNAVIGEWCNLGADTNNSNLKNNYDEVKIWSEAKETFVKTGLQFCGLFMGDHSKCGINTMFNTGTVIGVSANIFGGGFPRNFIPSFSWGGSSGMTEYKIDKAAATTARVFARRNKEFTQHDADLMQYVFDKTQDQRRG